MNVEFLDFIQTVLIGLMSGVMYSLVALGFVLIFKASGVFNFAQGVFALFAALTLVGYQTGQIPFAHLINDLFGTNYHTWYASMPNFLAIILTVKTMIALAWIVERLVLKHLINQEPIILFMATIGLAFVLEGVGSLMWGDDMKVLDVGIPSGGSDWLEQATIGLAAEGSEYYGMYIDKLNVWATVIAVILVVSLALFSQYTKTGRALRAVADDHQAALSVGISLRSIWILVWSISGFIAMVAGIMWGSESGVQFSLSLIALKALRVLILGGFTSIPGAIIGGLLIGVGEKLAEIYIGGYFETGALETWFAYVMALVFLLFRPQGLFGEKIIERV
jgi:branched-chain amino acid transport system permease protein